MVICFTLISLIAANISPIPYRHIRATQRLKPRADVGCFAQGGCRRKLYFQVNRSVGIAVEQDLGTQIDGRDFDLQFRSSLVSLLRKMKRMGTN
jgi:hypothetical protein